MLALTRRQRKRRLGRRGLRCCAGPTTLGLRRWAYDAAPRPLEELGLGELTAAGAVVPGVRLEDFCRPRPDCLTRKDR